MSEAPRCPVCAVALRPDQRFCAACGHRLGPPPLPAEPAEAVAGAAPPVAVTVVRPARRSARRAETHWQQFAPALRLWVLLLAINLVVGIAYGVADESSPWLDVGATGATAVFVLGFAWRWRRRLWPLLVRHGFERDAQWQPLAAMLGLAVFVEGYFWLATRAGVTTLAYLDDVRAAGWPLWIGVVLVSPCPAVFEELAFRGVIQQRLRVAMGRKEAIVVQGAMFAVLHMTPLVFVSHFAIGVVLGWVRDRTRSLYPGMAFHALWNLWVVLPELAAGGVR